MGSQSWKLLAYRVAVPFCFLSSCLVTHMCAIVQTINPLDLFYRIQVFPVSFTFKTLWLMFFGKGYEVVVFHLFILLTNLSMFLKNNKIHVYFEVYMSFLVFSNMGILLPNLWNSFTLPQIWCTKSCVWIFDGVRGYWVIKKG